MKKNEYKCERCEDIFTKTWSDEEAEKEFQENFGHLPKELQQRAIICEDCYQEFMKWYKEKLNE